MDQGDLALDQATDQNILGIGDGFKYREDLMTFGMSPPAPFDGFSNDYLAEPRNRAFGCYQDHAALLDKRQCLGGGHDLFPPCTEVRMVTSSSALPEAVPCPWPRLKPMRH